MHDAVRSRMRRNIPPVGRILSALGYSDLPRTVVVDVIRHKLAEIRAAREVPDFETILALVHRSVNELRASRFQAIINGTGIIIHTNFGRAPLAHEAVRALNEMSSAYSNLEYDLVKGERGRRASYVENALALLCRAEAATVVNNCAAALVLITRHFAGRKLGGNQSTLRGAKSEVIISRGELVQIGGGFRIGEILQASGAQLHEVGATNKTILADYARAINPNTAMILKVHRSNFFMRGFVESASSGEISALARKKGVPFVEDLGSGAMVPVEQFGIADHEPIPFESLKAGADLVCFSGDKLFGGPQAGIIAGKKRFIAALKRDPIFRALRCDKLCLAALQATVDLHLDQKITQIPTLASVQVSETELRTRAANICTALERSPLTISIGAGKAKAGGGTLPKSNLSSVTIDILPKDRSLRDFATVLRALTPPVIGYIAEQRFKLDLRTIFPQQDELVVNAIRAACLK
jgi:L-seryl-tRNA(Ser) seleniumtransferase